LIGVIVTGGLIHVPHAIKILPERAERQGGTSTPRFCECDDGITRLVRWHKPGPKGLYRTSHGPKSCFNEFVASRLGGLIDAPVLRADVVYVPRVVITPQEAALGAVPGFHCGAQKMEGRDFATKLPDGRYSYLPISKIANTSQLTAAAVLLAWLRIEDYAMDAGSERVPKWDNSVFFESRIENGTEIERYVLVDLENAFETAEWSYREWGRRTLCDPKHEHVLPEHLKRHLETLSEETRNAAFQKLGALDEAAIRECFSSYPEEWCGTAEREQAVEWTLVRARLLGRWFKLNNYTVEINYDPDNRATRYP
jgi:hypothetical protein